ncbi:Mitochondrial carrier family, partial [Globisporangium splendens]
MATQTRSVAPPITVAKRGFAMDFFLAGIATSGACVVSNPMEVVKTRMQLQGELAKTAVAGNAVPTVRYRNFAHGFFTICRTEGLVGIQRGLLPGMGYQTFLNAPRLGLFEPIQKLYGATDPTHFSFPIRNLAAAATSGLIGACVGSPFFLVKARIQAASSAATINAQYAYTGMVDGFQQILRTEGPRGLYRGMSGAIPRVSIGSGTQLATYTQAKTLVMAAGIEDGFQVQLGSSIVSGLVVTTAMNPFDVVSTRLYSQKVVNGKGELYDGVFDCLAKTWRAEGIRGFYKGWTAHYFRLGPHTVCTFVFWEQAKRFAANHGY